MQYKLWLGLACAGLSAAGPSRVTGVKQVYSRGITTSQDGPAVKNMMNSLLPGVQAVNAELSALTAANAATKVPEMGAKIKAIGKILESVAPTVAKSKPLGITDAFSLMTPGKAIYAQVNTTLTLLTAKKDIVKGSGKIPELLDSIRSLKPGIILTQNAIVTQLPASIKGQIPAGTIPTDEQFNLLIEGMVVQLGEWFEGKRTSFEVPNVPGLAKGIPNITIPKGPAAIAAK